MIVPLFFDYYIAISTKNCYYCNMIHKFSISNFHSVREEVVLDLRIPGTAPDLPRFRRSTAKPDIRLSFCGRAHRSQRIGQDNVAQWADRYCHSSPHSHPPLQESNPIKAFLPYLTKKTSKRTDAILHGVRNALAGRSPSVVPIRVGGGTRWCY